MKKLTIITSALTAMVSMGAMAQGYFNGGNSSATAIMIQDTTGQIAGGAATKVGVPANTAGFVGAGPGQVTIDLFAFAGNVDFSNPNSLFALLIGGQTPFEVLNNTTAVSPAPSQGTFLQVVNPTTLPTAAGFDGSGPITLVYYGIVGGSSSELYEAFRVAHITPAVAGSAATAPAVFGTGVGQIANFILINDGPEPSTWAIGSVGAGLLWFFRRRK